MTTLVTVPDNRRAAGGRTTGRIVALMDGSYESGEALRWARRLAADVGNDVIAVRAWSPGLGEFEGRRPLAAEAAREELATWCEDAGESASTIDTVVLDGELPGALDRFARAHAVPLVVVGLEPPPVMHAGEPAVLLRRLAHEMSGPVAFVPVSGAARSMRRIVLGVRGSASSAAAVAWLAEAARGLDVEVHAVHVLDPGPEWVPATAPSSAWRRAHRHLTGPWTEPLRTSGLRCTRTVVDGLNAGDTLARLALREHADGFVIGASDRTGRYHTRRGAMALRLAHRSGLAVIMAPPAPSAPSPPD